jgi:alanine dehydrogenase
MQPLTIGVFGTSQKQHEKRVPIHPDQIDWIDKDVRKHLLFEEGYGERFGMDDGELSKLTEGVVSRQDLFEQSDVVLLAKPSLEDFRQMKEGTIHWGWPHCVQQRVITQEAIDRKLTLIAWEAMHRWSKHGDWQMHVFSKNNEIAGYAGVFHAMGLNGMATMGHSAKQSY